VTFLGELVLIGLRGLFSATSLRESLLKPLLRGASVSSKLGDHLALPLQGINGFILREFGMADFCLQIVRKRLHLGQRPLRPFAGSSFRG
jgi:hypothetical protein